MKYRVEGGVASIGTDMVLTLDKAQAAARTHALEAVDNGWRPKSIVQFKVGEVIGIDLALDAMPRSLSSVLVPESKPAKGKAGKGKAGKVGEPEPADDQDAAGDDDTGDA